MESLASLQNAPAIGTLRNRASADKWHAQREALREKVVTKVREVTATTEADVSARHVKIAQALQSKALQRLQSLKPEDLSPSEVRQFLKDAAQIERDALGLNQKSTVNIKAEVRHVDEDPERARLARQAADALVREWENPGRLN